MRHSVRTTAPRYIKTWLHNDDNALGWFLEHPIEQSRYRLGKALSELGAALSRLGNSIHDDIPGDYWQGYGDGQQMEGMLTATTPPTRREDVRAMLQRLGLPSDDHALERMGWMALRMVPSAVAAWTLGYIEGKEDSREQAPPKASA